MEELVVEEIQELLEKENDKALKRYLDELNISDVEQLIDELPQYAAKFIETISLNRAVNVFRILDFPTQERIIKKLSGNKLNQIIKDLPPDDRTALFSELKGDVVKKMITLLPPEERKESLVIIDDSKWTYFISDQGEMVLGKSYVDGSDLYFVRQ